MPSRCSIRCVSKSTIELRGGLGSITRGGVAVPMGLVPPPLIFYRSMSGISFLIGVSSPVILQG